MNKVWQILKIKGNNVWTISKNATVLDGLHFLTDKKIGSLMVMDADKVVGIFSMGDLGRKVILIGKQPENTTVDEVMTRDLITVSPNQSVHECMALMTEHHVRHLPVFDGDQLVGILSIGDLVKDMTSELEFLVDQLTNYITGFS